MIGRRAPDAYAAVTWLFAGPDGDTNTLALRGSGRLDADNTARIAKGLDRRAGVTRGTNPLRLRHQGNMQAPGLA
jgi:hypothetical protein